jgi:hypothetical protein
LHAFVGGVAAVEQELPGAVGLAGAEEAVAFVLKPGRFAPVIQRSWAGEDLVVLDPAHAGQGAGVFAMVGRIAGKGDKQPPQPRTARDDVGLPACLLHRRKEQGKQDCNNPDDDEELDEGESSNVAARHGERIEPR